MIITVAASKGGVGKSTMCYVLTVWLHYQGRDVVLIDGDKQGTCRKWNAMREQQIAAGIDVPRLDVRYLTGDDVAIEATRLSKEGKLVIIDSPGMDAPETRTAIVRADLLLSVNVPTSPNLWEVETTFGVFYDFMRASNTHIPAVLVFNKADTHARASDIQQAIDYLERKGFDAEIIFTNFIKSRKVFDYSLGQGFGINEWEPRDEKAIMEVDGVGHELLDLIDEINGEG